MSLTYLLLNLCIIAVPAMVHTGQAYRLLSSVAGAGFFDRRGEHLLFAVGYTGYRTR